jgi:hypothetical protein
MPSPKTSKLEELASYAKYALNGLTIHLLDHFINGGSRHLFISRRHFKES